MTGFPRTLDGFKYQLISADTTTRSIREAIDQEIHSNVTALGSTPLVELVFSVGRDIFRIDFSELHIIAPSDAG